MIRVDNINRLLLGVVIVLVVVTAGVAFAYFSSSMPAGESKTTITGNAGKMNITYDGGNEIVANKLLPREEAFATKHFTVTGNNTTNGLDMPYSISLVVDAYTFTANAITYTLTGTNTGSNGTIVANTSGSISKTGTTLLGTGLFKSAVNKVHTYDLSLFYKDNGTVQNDDIGKTVKVHVNIEAVK